MVIILHWLLEQTMKLNSNCVQIENMLFYASFVHIV